MKKIQRKRRGALPSPVTGASTPGSEYGSLSASGLSSVRRQMSEFDDLPAEVRAALMSANELNDQMIDVLCAMNRGGFSVADMLKVITTSNAKSGNQPESHRRKTASEGPLSG
jgi:hypothetical protein